MLRGRQFSAKDFSHFDYIFVMDRSNYQNVIRLAKNEKERAKVHFLADALGGMAQREIPDPSYGTAADFENVYQLIDDACTKVTHKLSPNP